MTRKRQYWENDATYLQAYFNYSHANQVKHHFHMATLKIWKISIETMKRYCISLIKFTVIRNHVLYM